MPLTNAGTRLPVLQMLLPANYASALWRATQPRLPPNMPPGLDELGKSLQGSVCFRATLKESALYSLQQGGSVQTYTFTSQPLSHLVNAAMERADYGAIALIVTPATDTTT